MNLRGKRPDMRSLLFLLIVGAVIISGIGLTLLGFTPSTIFPPISTPRSASSDVIRIFLVSVIILACIVVFPGSRKVFRHWSIRVAETLLFYKECTLFLSALIIATFIMIYTTELHPIIAQNIEVFTAIMIAVLVGGISWAARSAINRRKERKEIMEKVGRIIFVDVASLTPGKGLLDDEVRRFYCGEKLGKDRFWETIIKGIDFRRSVYPRMECEFSGWNGKFHPCKVPIGEKQGKSLLAGRLAWELAKSTDNKVLWWKGDRESTPIAELPSLIHEYRRFLTKTKKLIVVMDDLSRYEEVGEDSEEAYYFLQEIDEEPIFLLYPSREGGQLRLEDKDIDNLMNRLVEKQLIDRAFAEKFQRDATMRRLHRDQLCLCMNLIAMKSQFMSKSQITMLSAKLSPEEDEVLKKIALCTTISLPYPGLGLQSKGTEFRRKIETGVLGSYLKEEEFQTGEGVYDLNVEKRVAGKGHILTAPVFAIQILRERYRMEDRKTLSNEFEKVLYDILSSAQGQLQTHFAMEYVRIALCRLVWNFQRPFYPEFRGAFLAQGILTQPRFGKVIARLTDELTDLDRILKWSSTFRWLSHAEKANKLMAKAEAIARERGVKQLDLRQVIQLAMGLKDTDLRELKDRAVIYFEKAIQKIFTESTSRTCNQVIDAYVDLTASLKGNQGALDRLEKLLDLGKGKFKPDAVLVRRRAQLLDDMSGRTSEAQKEFRKAIELARRDPSNLQSLVITLQRYGVFLSQREMLLDSSLREDPEVYFKEAAGLAKEAGLSYEAVLNAWAVHKEKKGGIENIEGARSLYEAALAYCDKMGVIHPPSLLGFAGFLRKHGQTFKDRAYSEWWQIAEDLCRKIIDYEEADYRSRLYANHQLGLLIGSSPPGIRELPNGSKRPDFLEAIRTIEKAFGSSETQRVDEMRKTFQDCVTHRSLAQIYARWVDSVEAGNTKETAPINALLLKIGFHSFHAFSGLSKRDNLTREMKEHIVASQIGYGGFEWIRNRKVELAKTHYDESIRNLEHWCLDNTSLRLACKSYWHVGNFYSYLYKRSSFTATEYLDYCEQSYKKALGRMPSGMRLSEKSRLRFKSVSSLYQQMQRLVHDVDAQKKKRVEASTIVEEGLTQDSKNPYLWSIRILLDLESDLDPALQRLVHYGLPTMNRFLKTLITLDWQAARKVGVCLDGFREPLKSMLIMGNAEGQCLFFAMLSVLNQDLGSFLLREPRIRDELHRKLDSLTATGLAQVSRMLVRASRMALFLDLCMSVDYSHIMSVSTLTSVYRLLARFVQWRDTCRDNLDRKNAETLGTQLIRALPNADLASLMTREDASLYRLNGVIDNVTELDKSQDKIGVVRLIECLGNLRLSPLFLKVDPVAQANGKSQAEVVNWFISGRPRVPSSLITKIVEGVPEHDWLYLIRGADREGNLKETFYLIWNLYRYGQPKAMRLACLVAEQLQSRSCGELPELLLECSGHAPEASAQFQSSSWNEPILIRLALLGLLNHCGFVTRHLTLSNADLETVKKMLAQRVAKMSLTMPLLSLIALKAMLGQEQFRQIKGTMDWELVNKTVQGNKDQNLRAVLSDLVKVLTKNQN